MTDIYRVGGKVGRTIYRGDELIGLMDTRELGALVVEALNARERVLAVARPVTDLPVRGPIDPTPDCGRVGMHNCQATGRWQNHEKPMESPL